MKKIARFVTHYAVIVSLIGTLIAMGGLYYSVQLYKNLRTDLQELLPTTARSVLDLNQVTARMASFQSIVVLFFSDQPTESKRFVEDLASELKSVPKETIYSVEYKISRELKFFNDRRSLYIDLEDLERIKKYIRDRIGYERELYNPLNIFGGNEIKEPRLDYTALKKKYESKVQGYDHFPNGYYATADEKIRAMVIYMPGNGLDVAQRMKAAIEKAVKHLGPQNYAGDLQVKYTGNVQNLLEESAALVEDLELSTVIVLVVVTIAMILFYRSFGGTLALIFSLFMGTFWTFGVAFFTVGYLNANTAFLASIVIGNGINFGTILLARYLEERRAQKDNATALEIAMSQTATSTLTAALAAGLSYGSLMLTGFRGFSQFGVIGLAGMILCWISAYTVLPAYLTIFERIGFMKKFKPSRGRISNAMAQFVAKFPKAIWVVSVLGVVASVCTFPLYKRGMIETDLTKLRDKRSMESGAGALYHYIDDIFKHSFSPMVILPKDRADTEKIAELLRKERAAQGANPLLTTVQTLSDFVPKDQKRKIQVLHEIRDLLPARLLQRLAPPEQHLVLELLNPKGLKPFLESDLPTLVLDRFKEKDGSFGKIVLMDKAIQQGSDDASLIAKFVAIGRDAADAVTPGTPVAGDLPITTDMLEAIHRDGPKATLVAFLAVVILVALLFHNFRTVGLILFALGLGVIWFAGLILGFHLKINFLNFIALPITFGIGVDYGVNIFARYKEEGSGNIINVIRQTGGAVLLCSFTTIVGYSSLLIAGNQAFVSFGRLAVLGEFTCAAAAVIALPAFLSFYEKRKSSSKSA